MGGFPDLSKVSVTLSIFKSVYVRLAMIIIVLLKYL